jgi:mycofactocin precursor
VTQQAVIETTPAQPGMIDDEPVGPGRVSDCDREEALVAEELLVEEVSIDGMCGVY